jgi:hypothetical protein
MLQYFPLFLDRPLNRVPFSTSCSMGLEWIVAAQSVPGGVAAGATEARALRPGAPNLRQAVESR